eukprot:scaffold3332_cov130-Isochrysis_galbana.AAC.2
MGRDSGEATMDREIAPFLSPQCAISSILILLLGAELEVPSGGHAVDLLVDPGLAPLHVRLSPGQVLPQHAVLAQQGLAHLQLLQRRVAQQRLGQRADHRIGSQVKTLQPAERAWEKGMGGRVSNCGGVGGDKEGPARVRTG